MKVAVVGAGWAGLSAALTLAQAGTGVTLYEAAPMAGGRARDAIIDTPLGRFTLDNGQHLMMGAYRDTLALIEGLGAGGLLRRERMRLSSPSGLWLQAGRLPAPLHLVSALLGARGLGPGARAGMLRLMVALRLARWRALDGETVLALLRRHSQPSTMIERLWGPLCIGALNTLPEAACANAFAAVLRDTLGAARADSEFVGADATLGALLPDPALARLRALGAVVRLRWPVRSVARQDGRWSVNDGARQESGYDALVLALPPWSAARLLSASGLPPGDLASFEPEPIATAWALWPANTAPALPKWSLLDEDARNHGHGQWLFDRGIMHARGPRAGSARVAGIVISVASRLEALDRKSVAEGIAAQIGRAFGVRPASVHLVTERRATFRCTPDRPRVGTDHLHDAAPELWLAGDWLWEGYPATLEAAVRSGSAAATAVRARSPLPAR